MSWRPGVWRLRDRTSSSRARIDGLLLGYDLRGEQAFKNRSHEAGVTALALNPLDDQQLVSGSYDERLRIFDLRMMREPLLRSERLGDGAYQVSDSDSNEAT